jgi:hypothetical protein
MNGHQQINLRTIASNAERLEQHLDLLIEDLGDDVDPVLVVASKAIHRATGEIVRCAREHGYTGSGRMRSAADVKQVAGL